MKFADKFQNNSCGKPTNSAQLMIQSTPCNENDYWIWIVNQLWAMIISDPRGIITRVPKLTRHNSPPPPAKLPHSIAHMSPVVRVSCYRQVYQCLMVTWTIDNVQVINFTGLVCDMKQGTCFIPADKSQTSKLENKV